LSFSHHRLRHFCLFLSILFLLVSPAFGDGNTTIQSFSKAKELLLTRVYYDHRLTFYCGCLFSPRKAILPCSNYIPLTKWKRAKRVEWEHIVPAHAFGQSFSAWRIGHTNCRNRRGKPFRGRNCARKVSPEFRFMEADLYNLVPAIGEINALRSNYSYALISGEKRRFGPCDMEIANNKAEPASAIRGNVARTYFYMAWAYPGHGILAKQKVKLFTVWNRQDPVDKWECIRCRRIEALQGNENPYVKRLCLEAGLW